MMVMSAADARFWRNADDIEDLTNDQIDDAGDFFAPFYRARLPFYFPRALSFNIAGGDEDDVSGVEPTDHLDQRPYKKQRYCEDLEQVPRHEETPSVNERQEVEEEDRDFFSDSESERDEALDPRETDSETEVVETLDIEDELFSDSYSLRRHETPWHNFNAV